jgi:hypothetical protein
MDSAVDPPAEGQPPNQEELAGLFTRLNFIRGTINNFETQLKQFPALTSTPSNSQNVTNQQHQNGQSSQNAIPPQLPFENDLINDNNEVERVSRRDQIWRNQPPSRDSSRGRDDEFRTISRCSSTEPEEVIPKFLLRERPPEFDFKTMSPPQYLEKLRDYIETHQIKSDKFKIACAKSGLERRYKVELHRFSRYVKTYSEFETMFLREFWSTKEKVKQRESVFKEKFQSRNKDESVYEFYRRTLDLVEKYYPEITMEELKFKFSEQVPGLLSVFIHNPNINDLDALNELMKSIGEWSNLDLSDLSNQKNEKTKRRSPERNSYQREYKNSTQNDRDYHSRNEYRQRPYNSRGNKNSQGETHRVNMVQEVANTSQNNYRGYNSHYKMNNRGGYRGQGKPYSQNYNHQNYSSNFQSDIDAKLNIFQQNIEKIMDDRFKAFENRLQPRQEMGGTASYAHANTAETL